MDDSAELFEAISHPIRIKILKLLEKQPSSFASLKRQLNIDSSGNLDHHLKKLGPLIMTREDGLYALSGAGKEALISIAAIETWKDDERRKKRSFIRAPRMIFVLALLELLIAAASTTIEGQIVSSSLSFSWFSILTIYTVVAMLALTSAIGLLTGKSWAWTLVVVEAAVLLMSGPIFTMYSILSLIRRGFIWTVYSPWLVMYPMGVWTLLLAMLPSLRESLGTRYSTPMPRRALIGGVLGIVSGAINLPITQMIGGPPALSGFMNLAGMAIVVGGVLILLRRYLVGALMLIITGSITYYNYFLIATVVFTYLSLPLGSGSLLVGVLLLALPIASGVLALISRSKLRS